MVTSHNLGFPRIGLHRELKKALESYWKNEINLATLEQIGRDLRKANWNLQASRGINWLPVGDFSWYDHILDMSLLLGVVPERFGKIDGDIDLDTYFRMARGQSVDGKETHACEMTKWFDTNYHYIVPELVEDQIFRIGTSNLFNQVEEAQQLGHRVKPVIVGPLTYLWLAKSKGGDFDKLHLLPKLLPVYKDILRKLAHLGCEWVQVDEPLLVLDIPTDWHESFKDVYKHLVADSHLGLPKILLATYFGKLDNNAVLACSLPISGLHLDATRNTPETVAIVDANLPKEKVLSIGAINGRNIWRADLTHELNQLKPYLAARGNNLWVAPSCSLLHVPVDLEEEKKMDEDIKSWLAFAVQKIDEVALLAKGLNEGEEAIAQELKDSDAAQKNKKSSSRIHSATVKQESSQIHSGMAKRLSPYEKRHTLQQKKLNLPHFPTTTIGSFPQTAEIRAIRHDFKKAKINEATYKQKIQEQIAYSIQEQEKLNIDVFVHGEAERNDMVEYFGEQMSGFIFTENGWVQSFGSRCVKPPIIFGDVARPYPMTIEWTKYACSLTHKPVKGMLTGPMTILCWSFVRDDQPRFETAKQIALALRKEVQDLEKAGVKIIQIDEPAFREGMPLRKNEWKDYLDNAIQCFKIASCGVKDETQIHSHMCYSEFNDIIDSIAALDVDVITIETSRSDMKLLNAFKTFNYPNEIGPGVYDIHSPRIPTVEEIVDLMRKAAQFIPKEKLWINPDCGLKTRTWPEVTAALENMVAAADMLRRE